LQLGFFKKQAKPLIGVDISASAVKMVELGGGEGQIQIERHAVVPLAREVVQEGTLNKPEAVEAALREAIERLGGSTRDVVIGLPPAAAISRRLILPADRDEDFIEEQAIDEASRMVPFPLDEISLDFQVLGPTAKNPNENDVLIVVTRRDRIDERLAVAEAVGLHPVIMDVDHYALLRACTGQIDGLLAAGKRIVAIVDLGAQATQVSFLFDNDLVYQREQAFGGQALTQDAARRFDLSLDEAETAKRKSTLPDPFATELVPAFLDAAALEIGRAMQMFFTSTPHQRIDHILVSGGAACLPGVAEVIHSRTQTPTTLADPFAEMLVSSRINHERLAVDAPLLHVACGLALRRFDPT